MQRPRTRSFMETGRVVYLPIGAVRPNPSQPRKVFDQQGLQELAASIVQYGILQPLSVRSWWRESAACGPPGWRG